MTLTATVTGVNPTGSVTFKDGTASIGTGTLTAGQATLKYSFLATGSHSITAVYAGDANNATSTSAAVSESVTQAVTTTILAPTPSPSALNQAVTLRATVTNSTSPTGAVTFMEGATTLGTGTVTNGIATLNWTFTTLGTHTLTASYAGDANNTASTSSQYAQSVTTAGQTLYYIHADHLATPRAITDTAANIVWQWDNQDPFGNNTPNENPSNLGPFKFNLRFPGQYFDRETNLAYNVMRDYDAATGRYIESDPIGLGGGVNTYAYVKGNPLSRIDPQGLKDYLDQCKGRYSNCSGGQTPSSAPWYRSPSTTFTNWTAWKGCKNLADWGCKNDAAQCCDADYKACISQINGEDANSPDKIALCALKKDMCIAAGGKQQ